MSVSRDANPAESPRSAYRPWRSWLPRGLFESVLIVLSVVLALTLDEWRRGREQRAELTLAVESVGAELADNRAAVDSAHAKHTRMFDSLSAYAGRAEVPPERIYYGGVFNPAGVLDIAWQSARDGGSVDRLPYELRLTLTQIYDRQTRYRALGDAIVQTAMSEMLRRGGEAVFRDGYTNFIGITMDFANREKNLVEAYDSALATLDRYR